jgi:hypothetical protein
MDQFITGKMTKSTAGISRLTLPQEVVQPESILGDKPVMIRHMDEQRRDLRLDSQERDEGENELTG